MFIVLDLETTGLSPKEDTIIEFAFVKIDRNTFKEIDRLTAFVDPGRPIPELISGITNIFDSDVTWAAAFEDSIDDIEDFIEWYPLIGHNISFDVSFLLSHNVDLSKNPYIDTFFLANFLCSGEKSLNLGHLCEVFKIDLLSAHRAIDDTLATVEVFRCLIEKLQWLPREQKNIIASLMHISRDAWVQVLKNEYLSEDKFIQGKDDIFAKYFSHISEKLKDNIDKIHYKEKVEIASFLSSVEAFELRESQRIMLDKVDNNFSKWEKLIVEAPTGTGKTLAYLLPAIKYSLTSWESVHISTSTKALQDQIFYKDLLFISENFEHHFSYTKLKWKRNYFSFHSFEVFFDSVDLNESQILSMVLKLMLWSLWSEYGELEELDFYGEEYRYISDIHAGNSFVFDEGNIYKKYEFALRARNRAKSSNIIITNNHILFQDIMWEWNLLGWVKNLVLDEAHSLEDIITSSLKKSLSQKSLDTLFAKITKKLHKYEIQNLEIERASARILFESQEIFNTFESSLFEKFSLESKYKSSLLSLEYFDNYEWLTAIAKRIKDDIGILMKSMWELADGHMKYFTSEYQELSTVLEMFEKVFFHLDTSTHIYYITHNDFRGTEFHYTVLQPWSFLRSELWKNLESVVLTSATLQMGDDFKYMKDSLELHDFETLLLPSDFNYSEQALLYIPQDLGSVKYNLPEVIDFLGKLFMIIKGRALVLFTSYMNIKETYIALKSNLQQNDITLLAQSISGGKHKQIESFKAHAESSILLGTDTFWEWIDIPWDDLKYLIIHKIPFQVPSDPIFQARARLYKDSFKEYSIPKSILKLKQWFWRLIRSQSDTGIVIFLDDRISSSSWWKSFLQAFPDDIKIRYGKSSTFLDTLKPSK